MRRTFLLLAAVSSAVLLAVGTALAVTPLGVAPGNAEASASAADKSPDAALDRALEELVAMEGGPPGVIAGFSAAKSGKSTPSAYPTWRTIGP